ncbi:hypothetical protein [Dactylosporangium darangshiense]|uniref:hypothetical protein n=1 Tax=Dactylosporangium darangshiense TaxID=579108 RepID=UPI0031F02A9A
MTSTVLVSLSFLALSMSPWLGASSTCVMPGFAIGFGLWQLPPQMFLLVAELAGDEPLP